MIYRKSNTAGAERFLAEVLDVLSSMVIVLRGEKCKTIYLNAAAKDFLIKNQCGFVTCKRGYAEVLPSLCD